MSASAEKKRKKKEKQNWSGIINAATSLVIRLVGRASGLPLVRFKWRQQQQQQLRDIRRAESSPGPVAPARVYDGAVKASCERTLFGSAAATNARPIERAEATRRLGGETARDPSTGPKGASESTLD